MWILSENTLDYSKIMFLGPVQRLNWLILYLVVLALHMGTSCALVGPLLIQFPACGR